MDTIFPCGFVLALSFLFFGFSITEISMLDLGVQERTWLADAQRFVRVSVFALCLLVLPRVMPWLHKNAFIVGILFIFGLSISWSSNRAITTMSVLNLSICLIAVSYVLSNKGLAFFLTWLYAAAACTLIASLMLDVVNPGSFRHGDGQLRGVMAHKNGLGSFSATIILLSFFGPQTSSISRTIRVLLVCLASWTFLQANSVTSVFAVLSGMLFVGALHIIQRFSKGTNGMIMNAGVLVPVFCILLYVLAAFVLPAAMTATGRNWTLTGRTIVWVELLPIIAQHPLGFGFGTGGGDFVREVISQSRGFTYSAIDNAALRLLLEVGWVGTTAYFFGLATFLLSALKCLSLKPQVATLSLATGIFMVVLGLAEGSGGPYPSIMLLVLLACMLSMNPPIRSRRSAA